MTRSAMTKAQNTMTKAPAFQVYRYLNEMNVLGYTSLSLTYNEDNFFDPLHNEWKLLNEPETKWLSYASIIYMYIYKRYVYKCIYINPIYKTYLCTT